MAALAKTWMLSVFRNASNTSNTGAWRFPRRQQHGGKLVSSWDKKKTFIFRSKKKNREAGLLLKENENPKYILKKITPIFLTSDDWWHLANTVRLSSLNNVTATPSSLMADWARRKGRLWLCWTGFCEFRWTEFARHRRSSLFLTSTRCTKH